jgi:hypothetical protein
MNLIVYDLFVVLGQEPNLDFFLTHRYLLVALQILDDYLPGSWLIVLAHWWAAINPN